MPLSHQTKERIIIFDTTLRDGDQSAGYAMTIDEKLRMAQALANLNVDVIEAGFPVSSALDFKAVELIAREIKGPRIAALARATEGDIQQAADALTQCLRPRIHTFIATSDEHMEKKLRKTRPQVKQAIDQSVRLACDFMKGRGDVEWSAEDASRSNPDFLIEAVGIAIEAGATTINLPDTVGYSMPSEYQALFTNVIKEIDPSPDVIFSAHTHNDLGMAVATSLAALQGGARQVECTVKGIGERAGNAQMEAIVANLDARADIYPFTCAIAKQHLKPVADTLSALIPDAPLMMPVVGENARSHSSGVHQQGMLSGGGYEILDLAQYGHQGTPFPLTRHSGEAGVMAVLEERGLVMPQESRGAFLQAFKDAAGGALENHSLRIVPPDMAEIWAQNWMTSRNIPPNIIAKTPSYG